MATKTRRYDAIIVGAGQAGPSLAGQLVGEGQRVALIEGNRIGGTCVNTGCIPTKTIIASARVAYLARRAADFGVHAGEVTVDMAAVIDRKQARVEASRGGLEDWLRSLDGLDIHEGYGHFSGTGDGLHRLMVNGEEIAAPHVFLNTGASPFVPPIAGLESVGFLTNEGLLNLRELPAHLIILGGGYIGLEMAQAWRRFGARVTVIEANPVFLHREDRDIAAAIREILEGEGVQILTGQRAVEVTPEGGVTVRTEAQDGHTAEFTGSHLLVAIGRRPNSAGLQLDAAGVATDERGYITVDAHLRTNVPGIWAMGDVNGRGAFTHTSYQDYEIVWDNLNGGVRELDRPTTYALFIDPPLGRVGLSEDEVRAGGRAALMAVKPMARIGRALEQSETQGLIKLLVDAETRRFLGAAVLGYRGDDVIQAISYYMATGADITAMQHALPIHPTISEFLPTTLGELQPL
jgi:pyruvate/2-oxoglutarate dehydrogenase complex dihydrolipoamide dehydrogenase (E3) component